MTTGTENSDTLIPQVWYDNGETAGSYGNLGGRKLSKSWNGADWGSTPARLPQVTTKHWSADTPDGPKRVTKTYRPRSVGLDPHEYHMVAQNVSSKFGRFQLIGDYDGTRTFENVTPLRLFGGFPPSLAWPVFDANDEIKLLNKFKGNARVAEFNLGTFLGEGREAVAMVGDAAIRIARSLSYVKAGNLVAAANVLSSNARVTDVWRHSRRKLPKGYVIRRRAVDQLSANWLELAWGWIPLVQDIHSGAEFLAHKLNVPFRSKVLARRTKTVRHEGPGWKWSSKGRTVSKQYIAYFSEPESIPKLLGLLDPSVVLWELTPLSALVDYVVPIGQWLEARAYAQGLTGTFISTTVTKVDVRGLSLGQTFERVPGYPAYYTGDDLGSFYRSISLDRVILTHLDVPYPRVKPLNEIATVGHCVNALAVLAQIAQGNLKTIPISN